MSDDSAPTPPGEDEDAFSRAFRERWGDLADRADRVGSGTTPAPDPVAAAPIHRDPTAPLWQSDTAPVPAPSPPAPPRPGDPLPPYGPPPGAPRRGYADGHRETGPSAAALLIVSGVTMAFTMLFIGLPSLVIGAIATGEADPRVKSRRLRVGWIVYAVNWAFVVIGFVLLVVAFFVFVGTL